METVHEHVMPPKSGHAVVVKKGQHLRITDLEGKQVVDVAVFSSDNYREKLSTSNSRTRYWPKPGEPYVPRDHLTEGDTLMSTLCRPLMTIVKETPVLAGVCAVLIATVLVLRGKLAARAEATSEVAPAVHGS